MLRSSLSKCVALLLTIMTLLSLLSAATFSAYAAETFYKTAEQLEIKVNIEEDASLSEYATVQGACCDGKYAYIAVQNGSVTLLKYDMKSFECVNQSPRYAGLGHANDMTYNSKEGFIAVANNAPDYDIVTLVDPETLEAKSNVKLEKDIYSIAYCPSLDCYFVGISGGYDFAKLDKDFKVVKEYKGVDTGYTRQGLDCDGTYLYFVQSAGSGNLIVVYTLDGAYLTDIAIENTDEIENIFHAGSDFYATFHYYGNFLFRLGLSDKKRIEYTVHYNKGTGEGEMADTVVHYGEDTKLSKNIFTRNGCFFSGWMMKRDCDGKILGFTAFSGDPQWLYPEDANGYILYDDETYVSDSVKIGDVTLTPFFVKERYNIVFDSAEDTEGYMPPSLVAYGDEYVIPENAYTKTGYVFDGYIATRTVDTKTFGFAKGSDKPDWLTAKDLDTPYRIYPGDTVSRLTYDGEVRLSARFKPAFSYSEDRSELISYVGVDEDVSIPDNGGALTEITGHCFSQNEAVSTVSFPGCVTSIDSGAIEDCSSLKRICFTDALPRHISGDAVKNSGAPSVYLYRDGNRVFLGWLTDSVTVTQMKIMERILFENNSHHE